MREREGKRNRTNKNIERKRTHKKNCNHRKYKNYTEHSKNNKRNTIKQT